MIDFTNEILEDINWRMGEIATAKSLPYRYNIPPIQRLFLLKHSIPIIYASWEGYIRSCIEIYARKLNKLGRPISYFSKNIVTNSFEVNFPQMKSSINNYRQSMKFVDTLICYLGEDFKVSPKVPTTNNINIKVLNNILERYSIFPVKNPEYESGLNKLLQFRNAIAHGDNSISVDPTIVSEFSTLVYDLMYAVFDNIENSYKMGTYAITTEC